MPAGATPLDPDGVYAVNLARVPADLAQLVALWPRLPVDVRQGIIAIATGQGDEDKAETMACNRGSAFEASMTNLPGRLAASSTARTGERRHGKTTDEPATARLGLAGK